MSETDTDVAGLVKRLGDEADLCRNDGADDIAELLDEAAAEIARLEAECFRLAAGVCIKPGTHGLLMGEGGHSFCSAFEALQAEEEKHSNALTEIARLRGEVGRYQEALVQHNDRLRSAQQIAYRDGAETNWQSFRGQCTYTLAEYHELTNEARAALAQRGGDDGQG